MVDTVISLLDATNTLALKRKVAPLIVEAAIAPAQSTAIIPLDNTKPQISEGTEIASAVITPTSTTSKIRARIECIVSASTARSVVVALFVNGGTDAVAATFTTIAAADYVAIVSLEYDWVPGALTAQTVTARFGPGGAAATVSVSRSNGTAAFFNGVLAGRLTLEEIHV